MKYIQLFEIPILCFLCFVLLDTSATYAKTPNAFIFSLNNYERLAPFVSKVKLQNVRKAIHKHSHYGPKFGSDLVIYCDLVKRKSSKATLGSRYSIPAGVQAQLTVLAGTRLFSPDEVEVFFLGTSR